MRGEGASDQILGDYSQLNYTSLYIYIHKVSGAGAVREVCSGQAFIKYTLTFIECVCAVYAENA